METSDPRAAVRNDLLAAVTVATVYGLPIALTAGVGVGLMAGLLAVFLPGLAITYISGLVRRAVYWRTSLPRPFGVSVPVPGLVGLRYLALLLCTRRWQTRWLPWRLGRFLHRCYEFGLLRIAGNGYQFRHRELQDYLARHPTPAGTT